MKFLVDNPPDLKILKSLHLI